MQMNTTRSYLFYLGLFLVSLLFMGGCAHRELTKKERKLIRSSYYMKGFIHGIYVGKNEEGNVEFEKFEKTMKKVK